MADTPDEGRLHNRRVDLVRLTAGGMANELSRPLTAPLYWPK